MPCATLSPAVLESGVAALVLLLTVAGFTAFTTFLVVCRRNQLHLENLLGELERATDP